MAAQPQAPWFPAIGSWPCRRILAGDSEVAVSPALGLSGLGLGRLSVPSFPVGSLLKDPLENGYRSLCPSPRLHGFSVSWLFSTGPTTVALALTHSGSGSLSELPEPDNCPK